MVCRFIIKEMIKNDAVRDNYVKVKSDHKNKSQLYHYVNLKILRKIRN